MNTAISKTESAPSTQTTSVQYRRPAYEVVNLEGAYEVHVQVPGCNKEGIQIHHEKDVLTIQATRQNVVNADWKRIHREIPESDFQLKLNLNVDINSEQITAKTEDGVLRIHLPIAEEAKPRQISVD